MKNLLIRVSTGIVFVAVLLGSILYSTCSFAILLCIIEVLALYEFYKLVGNKSEDKIRILPNLMGGILLFAGAFLYFSGYNLSLLVFTPYILYLLLLFVAELYLKNNNPLSSLAYSIVGQVYIAVPFSLINYLVFSYGEVGEYHYAFLLALFIILWVNDSFAYLFGVTLGKHRLFERISPKKSWEGFIGGALASIAVSFLLARYLPLLSNLEWVGFAATVVIAGTLGDLMESLMKRTVGVKDSGTILPGHGGILDRFDSMIFSVPALVIYLEMIKYF